MNVCQKLEVEIVEDLMNKLDRYAAGKSASSMLTINDLRAATEQYMNWDERNKRSFKRRYHQIKLLEDFLFIPMSRFCEFISETGDQMTCKEDMEMQEDYVHRLELFYKQFKPAYQGEMLGYDHAPSKKTDLLLGSLLNLKDHKPLTKKILIDAAKEYRAYKKRIEDIALHDDIFACTEELRLQMNYLNRGEVKLLAEITFPLVDESELNEEKLNSIKNLYQTEFSKLKDYKVHNGIIVKIVRV